MVADASVQSLGLVVALAAVILVLVAVLAVLLIRRRSGWGDPARSLERIGTRLDQLERLSTDIGNLSQVFLLPQARGGLGETLLAEILHSWLPQRAYALQHGFRSGARVDAVVKLGQYLVPIDAKFPLESVRRAITDPENDAVVTPEVKQAFNRHVKDISDKYILPDEGTLQFALMYIPSERVYYQVFVETDSGLLEAALQRNVVPVGPGSLFLYLQTVAYGLRGFAFPRRQMEVVKAVERISTEIVALARSLGVAGGHLKNLQKAYEDTLRRAERLDVAVSRLREPDDEEA